MPTDDPLHRLHSTPTKATKNHRWDVSRELERARTKDNVKWGVDDDARATARCIAAKSPPSVATRLTTPTKKNTARLYSPSSNVNHSPLLSKTHHRSNQVIANTNRTPRKKITTSLAKTPDPLHRLHATPTKATTNQRWYVRQVFERNTPVKSRRIYQKTPARKIRRSTSSIKSDPLHRLHSTPTKATTNQRWDVAQDLAKCDTNKAFEWTLDRQEKARRIFRKTPAKKMRRAASLKRDAPAHTGPPKLIASRTKSAFISFPDFEKIKTVFSEADKTKSSRQSLMDMDKAIATLYPGFDNRPAITAAYKNMGVEEEGFITNDLVTYFLHYMVNYNNLWSFFMKNDDSDKDQRISRNEFLAAAAYMELKEEPDAAFSNIVANESETVSFDELCLYLAYTKSGMGTADDYEIFLMEKQFKTGGHRMASPNATPEAHKKQQSDESNLPTAFNESSLRTVEFSVEAEVEKADNELAVDKTTMSQKTLDLLDENISGMVSLSVGLADETTKNISENIHRNDTNASGKTSDGNVLEDKDGEVFSRDLLDRNLDADETKSLPRNIFGLKENISDLSEDEETEESSFSGDDINKSPTGVPELNEDAFNGDLEGAEEINENTSATLSLGANTEKIIEQQTSSDLPGMEAQKNNQTVPDLVPESEPTLPDEAKGEKDASM